MLPANFLLSRLLNTSIVTELFWLVDEDADPLTAEYADGWCQHGAMDPALAGR